MAEAATIYDEIPYDDYIFHYTHPACMGAVAVLFGMEPANPQRCRILELGCAAGANLIPMACELPGSEFVGIDLSPRQIEQGQRTVAALGLTNIDLRPRCILDVDDSFGRFDYIICHGVYSWVPIEVRERILAVCNANLAPGGIAYISYNTYPGWHLRGMVREMMTYHVSQLDDAGEHVRQARALLNFMAQTAGAHDAIFRGLLRREADLLGKASDAYVFHDYLEDVNAPVYFHQFAGRAAAHGLQYVAEAQPSSVFQTLSDEARNTLGRLSRSLIQAEQYLDFLSNRTFRRTLLCHQDVVLRRPPHREAMTGLYLIGLVRPVAGPAEAAVGPEEFRGRDGRICTDDPVLRAALRCLFESLPGALSFDALFEQVRARLPNLAITVTHRPHLAEMLLHCYFAGLVELRARPPALAVAAGERPRASPLAMFQAASDQPLCNLCHHSVTLNPFDRLVLQQLDGTRGREALVDALAGLAASSAAVRDLAGDHDGLRQAIVTSFDRIARSGLLVAAAGT
jgi:methyltransferase-like protein/SAM-dependent methyltransferase